jgi:hypothetical protein
MVVEEAAAVAAAVAVGVACCGGGWREAGVAVDDVGVEFEEEEEPCVAGKR